MGYFMKHRIFKKSVETNVFLLFRVDDESGDRHYHFVEFGLHGIF